MPSPPASPGGVAAAITVAAVVGRLVSDHRHNRRIARKQREAETRGLEELAAELEPDAKPGKGLHAVPLTPPPPPPAGQAVARSTASFASLFLASVLLLLSGLPQLAPELDRRHQLSAAAACLSLVAGLFSILTLSRSKAVPQPAAVAAEEPQSEPVLLAPRHNLTGTWVKDRAASDSMAPAIELARLGRLVRGAVSLIKGIQIAQTDGGFEMAVFSVVPWFKVRELYPLSGELCNQRRRDLRRGHHVGRAVVTPAGRVRLEFEWPEPVGGRGWDEFELAAEGELRVHSHIEVGQATVQYTQVYRKR